MPKRSKLRRSKRDYAVEYKRRISRATAKGYSRSIARGHPPKGVIGIRLAAKLRVPVGTKIADISLRETLPKHPWDMQGDNESDIKRALRDEGLAGAELLGIEYTDQETFVKQMLEYGFTFREAFDLYFGY